MLLEGEISAETFDVEAFLPESYAAGTLSALSSPVSAANRRTTISNPHAPTVRFRADERMWRAIHAVQAPRHHVVRRGPGVPVSDRLGPANVRLTRERAPLFWVRTCAANVKLVQSRQAAAEARGRHIILSPPFVRRFLLMLCPVHGRFKRAHSILWSCSYRSFSIIVRMYAQPDMRQG